MPFAYHTGSYYHWYPLVAYLSHVFALTNHLSNDLRTLRVEQKALQRGLLCEEFLCAMVVKRRDTQTIAKVKHEDGESSAKVTFLLGEIADPGNKILDQLVLFS